MGNVIIMRGLPGSGKSTYIEKNHPGAFVCSADHYFMTENGYKFDPSKLGAAHGSCLQSFIGMLGAMKVGTLQTDTVVVDNTNITIAEIAPYYAIAEAYGMKVFILEVKLFGFKDVDVCKARNVHNVPGDAIERMYWTMLEEKPLLPKRWHREIIAFK